MGEIIYLGNRLIPQVSHVKTKQEYYEEIKDESISNIN